MHVLLIEDHDILGAAMKGALEQEGHTLCWCQDGVEAVAALARSKFDIVLLDLGLPALPGEDVLKVVRRQPYYIPVIIITARESPQHRIMGLDAGADDFLVKPVDLAELSARIRAHIRRQDGRMSNILSVREVEIDLIGKIVQRNGEIVHLTAKEFKLVVVLVRRKGRFVSKEDLAHALYDDGDVYDSNIIEVAISAIRRKLGSEFVLTARGLGYMVAK